MTPKTSEEFIASAQWWINNKPQGYGTESRTRLAQANALISIAMSLEKIAADRESGSISDLIAELGITRGAVKV